MLPFIIGLPAVLCFGLFCYRYQKQIESILFNLSVFLMTIIMIGWLTNFVYWVGSVIILFLSWTNELIH